MILRGVIRAFSPLHIGTIGAGNYHPTLNYIPARTLRGMLGNYLFHTDSELCKTLGITEYNGGKVVFKPALPTGSVASPVILSWCKGCGRLIEESKEECCECLQEGKGKGGFMQKTSYDEKKFKPPDMKLRIDTKCPITRRGHTSPSDRYTLASYNVGALAAGAEFDFRCLVEDAYVDRVKEALKEAGLFCGLGGFRSKGYGLVEFEFDTGDKEADYIAQRTSELEDSMLLMVLNSEAIFVDSGRYAIGFKAALLEKDLGTVTITKQKYTEGRARGWMIERSRGEGTKKGYGLDRIVPATGTGSSALLNVEARKAAKAELNGIGDWKSIYGDVYFRRWEDVIGAK
jgi:hypothetical protein